jgi:hypothetical protein
VAKIALLIGVSEYEPGLNPLPAAVRDIEALQKLLVNPAIGGFAESDVVLLKNPNRQTMEEAIETLFTGRSKDDLVLLFFSGHGIKDDAGRLFLATRGTRKIQGDLIRSTAVQSNFIQDNMSRSRSKRQVVILDSCFSGAFAEGLSAKDDGTIDIRSQLGGEGRAILTSSSSTQYSFEHEGSELSLYTRFLIEGIETGAADTDEDEVVSIDELHEYASRKVKEIKPELKPEIFAIREGFKIRLTKVPAIDPQQKYRREVARFMNYRGEISSINRRTLNIIKNRLQLNEKESQAIEHEILEPTRIKFRENLQEYELAFSDVIQKNENLSDLEREDLGQFQRFLELSDGDTREIESKVKAQLQAYRQHLQEYEEVFRQALKLEYPPSDSQRVELQKIQQKLKLKEIDIISIEAKVTAEIEAYYRHLEQYKQIFIEATKQEYPLGDTKRRELLQQQENLCLSDLDISIVESEIMVEIESYQQKVKQYQQKLNQYQQAFLNTTQAKYLPTSEIRKQLRQTWQTLGLTQIDVTAIEFPIIAEINLYQQNLEQYKKEFDSAVHEQYPLSEAKHDELTQLKLTLNLSDDDVTSVESSIEAPIKAAIEEHLDKLQQYEEAFLEAMEYEFPLAEETRQDLKRFQQVLEISNEDRLKIEKQVMAKRKEAHILDEPYLLTEKSSHQTLTEQADLSINQEEHYQQRLNKYKQEFLKTSHLLHYDYRQNLLKQLQSELGLNDEDISSVVGDNSPPSVQSEYRVEELSQNPNNYPPLSSQSKSVARIDWIDWTYSFNNIYKILKKVVGFLGMLLGSIWSVLYLVAFLVSLSDKSVSPWLMWFSLLFGLIATWSGWLLFTNRPCPILFKKIWIKYLYEKILTIPTPLRKKILIGLSVLVLSLVMIFAVWPNLPSERQKARETEVKNAISREKNAIGMLNRAQQVYFNKKAAFASDINTLAIDASTLYSKYYVVSIPTPGVALALTNWDNNKKSHTKSSGSMYFDSNIKSYIGGVSFNLTTKTFSTVICRQTGSEPLTIKNITGYGVVEEGGVACGPNTEEVQLDLETKPLP